MKAKYKKIIAFSLAAAVIAAVSAYTWLPGTKTVARQGVKATKAAAAHYLSTDAVDASNIRQVITADSTTSRTFMWQSDYAEENPVVEYRQAGDDTTIMQLPASSDAFSDDGVRPMNTASAPATSAVTGSPSTRPRAMTSRPSSSRIPSPATTASGPPRPNLPGSATRTPSSSSTWATLPTTGRPTSSGGTGLKMPMS